MEKKLPSAAQQPLLMHEARLSAMGGIVAPTGTRRLGATLAAVGATVGAGTRIASTAAHAACAAARSVTGRGAGSSSARTSAGSSTRSARSTAARLRVGETDRRTGKQRTQGHRENCLSHVSVPFDVVVVKASCTRMFLTADDKLSQFVRNDGRVTPDWCLPLGRQFVSAIQRPAALWRLQFFSGAVRPT